MARSGGVHVVATRRAKIRTADCSRVITRLFVPGGGEDRVPKIIDRVLTLTEEQVHSILDDVMEDFAHRHRRFAETLQNNYAAIAQYIPEGVRLSEQRKLLLGAYFTNEYSIQSAGVLNPSIVPHPDQDNLHLGQSRYLMTFRCVGEGHISSLEFRSCVIDDRFQIMTRPISCHVETPDVLPNDTFEKKLLRAFLAHRGVHGRALDAVLKKLPEQFSRDQLMAALAAVEGKRTLPRRTQAEIGEAMAWMEKNVYSVKFRSDTRISGRVLFPVAENECRGIEDVRFVRFVDDDGSATYYGTYTGYNGFAVVSRVLETKDFLTFRSTTLFGKAARNKGLALFPRRVNGKYVLLSRMDNESNYVSYSDNIYCWEDASLIRGPVAPWEFIQIGNGGSPVETEAGWLMITHGVGPLRKYCLGVDLLDLNHPSKLIGSLEEPILTPSEYEREGYVPNVVYACGAVRHQDQLIITYAVSDWESGIATVPVRELLRECTSGRR